MSCQAQNHFQLPSGPLLDINNVDNICTEVFLVDESEYNRCMAIEGTYSLHHVLAC